MIIYEALWGDSEMLAVRMKPVRSRSSPSSVLIVSSAVTFEVILLRCILSALPSSGIISAVAVPVTISSSVRYLGVRASMISASDLTSVAGFSGEMLLNTMN